MKVTAIASSMENIDDRMRRVGFSEQTVFHFTSGREYSVYSMSVFKGVVFLLILNDYDLPDWVPACLFTTTTANLPASWEANVFQGDVSLVLGPAFVSGSVAAYSSMIDMKPESIQCFWEYVKTVEA